MAAIYEWFGYHVEDTSDSAEHFRDLNRCPFVLGPCQKRLSDGKISGVCSIRQPTRLPVICCPIRLYGDDYRVLKDVSRIAFQEDYDLVPGPEAAAKAISEQEIVVAVFGKGWGKELHLPQRAGSGRYYVDWILALVGADGTLLEFVAIEVQSIDTTGNYRNGIAALEQGERKEIATTAGLNWENVNKRIIPQLLYKGNVLQREKLCKKGLFFVTPHTIQQRVFERLGGGDTLIPYALQPASITFLSYDYIDGSIHRTGEPLPIAPIERRSTTVYKVQEAFSTVTLPEPDVY